MICENPYVCGGVAYSCGGCPPCRINHKRVWAHRIELEALSYEDNCFATVTYDDLHVPRKINGLMTLAKEDVQLWMKRLRWKFGEVNAALGKNTKETFRMFYVGEYGTQTWRPHYHAALFGFPSCRYGQSRYATRPAGASCCPPCDMVRDTWGQGNIYLGSLGASSAEYVSGYVSKKMTRGDDPRLVGREPEFMECSKQKGGLGIGIVPEIAATLVRYGCTDVPVALNYGKKQKPLGRYLRGKIREAAGLEKGSQATLRKMEAEMFDLRLAARADKENPSFKAHLMESMKTKVVSSRQRAQMHKKREWL